MHLTLHFLIHSLSPTLIFPDLRIGCRQNRVLLHNYTHFSIRMRSIRALGNEWLYTVTVTFVSLITLRSIYLLICPMQRLQLKAADT